MKNIASFLTDASLEYTSVYYDGKAKTPKITIKGLKQGTDFKVSYRNNVVTGTATVTVTGIGKYSGTVTKTFKITARPVLLAKAVSKKKFAGRATITWKAVNGAARYVIYLGLSKKGSPLKKIKTVTAGSKLKYVVKKLAVNGSYKFRIVAQKLVNGKYEDICQSTDGHFVTGKNSRYTNAKKVKAKKKKVKVSKGKTIRIKGTARKAITAKRFINKKRVQTLRVETDDPSVIRILKTGRIKGLRKGKCKVYLIGPNGVWKTLKITVK